MYKKPVETGMAEASSSASCCSGQAYEQASSFSIWHKRNTSFSLSSILQYLIMTRKGKNSNKNKSGYRDIGLYQHLIRGVFYIICSELYISIPILPQFATSAFTNVTVAEIWHNPFVFSNTFRKKNKEKTICDFWKHSYCSVYSKDQTRFLTEKNSANGRKIWRKLESEKKNKLKRFILFFFRSQVLQLNIICL